MATDPVVVLHTLNTTATVGPSNGRRNVHTYWEPQSFVISGLEGRLLASHHCEDGWHRVFEDAHGCIFLEEHDASPWLFALRVTEYGTFEEFDSCMHRRFEDIAQAARRVYEGVPLPEGPAPCSTLGCTA